MKIFALATLASLAMATTTMAQPAHDHSTMPAMSHSKMGAAKEAAAAQGVGVVKSLNAKAGKVTLQHGPMPALKWPAMTMAFKADPALLKGLKTGQKVVFSVKTGQGDPQIVSIKAN